MLSFVSSPLEQFTLITILPLWFGPLQFNFTNSALFMLTSTGLFLFFSWAVCVRGGYLIPTAWQSLFEMIYAFVVNLVQEQVGTKGRPYVPFIFVTFTFLLCCNLIGMIPYSFTPTSHLVVTFTLSMSTFIAMTVIGFQTHGIHFFSFLLPPGAPLALAPFLVVIEFISYCFRGISLGVRLFANMMAGHTLVKILAGFGWKMLCSGGIVALGGLAPVAIVFALTFLEIGVAILQAYVFTILTCIYINDAIQLH
jgi:F-type H+-transporting ATPase subunit a